METGRKFEIKRSKLTLYLYTGPNSYPPDEGFCREKRPSAAEASKSASLFPFPPLSDPLLLLGCFEGDKGDYGQGKKERVERIKGGRKKAVSEENNNNQRGVSSSQSHLRERHASGVWNDLWTQGDLGYFRDGGQAKGVL